VGRTVRRDRFLLDVAQAHAARHIVTREPMIPAVVRRI